MAGKDRTRLFSADDLRIGGLHLLFILLALAVAAFVFLRFHELSDQQRRVSLREKVDLARRVLQPTLDDLRAGRLDPAGARRAALRTMALLTYEDASRSNRVGMHSLDGSPLSGPPGMEGGPGFLSFEDRQGNALLPGVVQRLRDQPEGFFVSHWADDPRSGRRGEQLSFVQALPDLGAFLDARDFDREVLESQRQLLAMGLSAGLLLLGLFAFPLALSLHHYRERNLRTEREIQERLKAEAALRRSEATLKAILDSVPIGIATLKDRRFIDVNEAYARIFQRDRSEFRGQSTRMCYTSDAAYETAGHILYQAPFMRASEEVHSGQRADGSQVHLLLRVAPLGLEGATDEYVIIALDVTKQKRAEDELRESHRFSEAVMDSIPGVLYVHDLEGRAVRWNSLSERLTGYSAEEMKSRSLLDWSGSDEEGIQRIRATLKKVVREGHADVEADLAMKDGRRVPYHLTASKVDIGGRTYLVSVGLDMTGIRKAEEEIRRSQEKFRIIFDASPLLIALNDPATGTYVDVNARCCEVLGLTREEIVGRTSQELGLALEEDKRQTALKVLGAGGTINAMDMKLTLPVTGIREALVTIRMIPMEDRPLLLIMAMDITEWRRSERATQESERQLRTLFEGSPIGMFRTTPEGLLQQANPALAAMFRYADPKAMMEEVNPGGIGSTMYEHPAQRADLMRRLKERAGTWFIEAIHFRRGDGTFLDGIMSITLHADPETGRPLLFGFVQDISESKRTMDELKAKTALLEAQTNATLDGILVVSDAGKRILTNKRTVDLFQVPRHILELEDDAPLLQHVVGLTRDPDQFLEKVRYLYDHPAETSSDEIEFRNGMVLERYSAPVQGEHGEIYGRIWIFHDISERKRSEQDILHLKNYFSNVIDAMPSAVIGLDQTGRVTGWNRVAEALLGTAAPEAIGQPIEELAKEFSPWIASMRQEVQREHRPASREKLLLERGGVRNFYELMLYPVVIEGMEGSVVHIQDVTMRARIQELLLQTEKMVSLGGLAAGMAHEINNPLGIISQAIQNIERRLSPDLPANQVAAQELGLEQRLILDYFEKRQIFRFMGSIREAVDRAARIVSNMLLFSRQVGSSRQPASLTDLVEKALELAANDYDLKTKYGFRNLEIQRESEPGLPLVKVVAIEIEQVLLNLFKNAAQAMAANPPERKPRLVLRTYRDAIHVVMEIEDNGPGMDEDTRRRVFEPFFTTKAPGVGTGLGLSVSYTIVTQNHKGLMEVDSTPGKGSRFTMRLPALQEQEEA